MPAQRRSRRSPLECAQCTEGQMECSKARPHCDECISQRRSCRYGDQTFQQPRKAARKTTNNSVASDSSFYSSPSPPPTEHRDSITSSTSSDSIESTSSLAKPEDPDSAEICAAVKDMSIGDQKLLENWCASTESSLTHSKNKDRSWQSVLRRESVAHAALRHSLLALSAIQLASITEDNKAQRKSHLQEAENHYRQAVDDFPPQSDDLVESGCNSAFSTASVLFMCELAFPSLAEDERRLSTSATHSPSPSPKNEKEKEKEQPPSPCLDRLLDLFRTIRGLSSCTKVLDVVEKGELKDLFSQSDPYHQLPSTYTLPIFAMKNLNNATAKKDSTHETEVYDDAISKLDRSLEMLSKGGEPTMIALRWMFRVPSRYLELVRERQPLALIIFAHYCAVLHHLRDRWWMDDRGSRLVKEISQLLGQDRQGSILWASDIVGIQT